MALSIPAGSAGPSLKFPLLPGAGYGLSNLMNTEEIAPAALRLPTRERALLAASLDGFEERPPERADDAISFRDSFPDCG